jgi:hypothetical protein
MNYINDDRKNIGSLYTEMYKPKNNANLIKEAYEEDGEKVREFKTYSSWKSAVKKLDPSASFTGDRDIDSYKGKKFFAEWDGEKGEIRTKIVKEAYKVDDFVTYKGQDHVVVDVIDDDTLVLDDPNFMGDPFDVSISDLEHEDDSLQKEIDSLFEIANDYGHSQSEFTKKVLGKELQSGIGKLKRQSDESNYDYLSSVLKDLERIMYSSPNYDGEGNEDAMMLGDYAS